jgi:hypothetical protein
MGNSYFIKLWARNLNFKGKERKKKEKKEKKKKLREYL